ncbi:MAG: hypothetical protein KC620_08255 [Myxococcales bacterium]|nr:hypothetical protein [Myxococcales bacterium]
MRRFVYLAAVAVGALVVWLGAHEKPPPPEEPSTDTKPAPPAAITALFAAGDRLVTGDEFGGATEWSIAEAKPGRRWIAHAGPIRRIVPQGDGLMTVSADGSVALFGADGAPRWRRRLVGRALNDAVMMPDGALIVAADQGTVARIDPGHRWRAAGFHVKAAFAVTPLDDETVASGGTDGRVARWQVADGLPAGEWFAHAGWVTAMARHGSELVTVGTDGRLVVWRPPAEAARLAIPAHEGAIVALAVEADEALTAGEDGTARLWRLDEGAAGVTLRPATPPLAVALADGRAFTAGREGAVSIWDVTDGHLIATLPDIAEGEAHDPR